MYGSRSRASARAPRRGAETRPDITRHESAGRPAPGFGRFHLRPELLRAVADLGFRSPRPIQEQGLPPALAGRDVLGLAQTGTGKTAAFGLPILQRLSAERRPGPRALVVAPTRELAAQVQAELQRLAAHTKITSVAVFGGVPIPRQVRALRQRPDVVVACPGRLLDLLGQGALRLDAVEVLVLDEADHMFDMGFLPDVRRILSALPARRQNLLFSATMPREIRRLADTVLRNPVVIELGDSKPAETIEHALYQLAEGEKAAALERLLAGDGFRSAIVFLRTKRRAKRLADRLDQRGHAAVALQGNMSQPQRDRALQGFREGRFDVLVATDIAARGLDILGVSHVVNFDVPNTPDAYTHRIGRTGRAEQSGKAFTFVTPNDAEALRAIEKRLGAAIRRLPLAELGLLERSTLDAARGASRNGASRNGASRNGASRNGASRNGAAGHGGARGGARGDAGKRARGGRRTSAAPARPRAGAAKAAGPRPTLAPSPAPAAGPAFGVGVLETGAPARERRSEGGAQRRRRRA